MAKETVLLMEDPSSAIQTPITVLEVDSVDGSKFVASGVEYWSASNELEVTVMPNGVVTGGVVTPGTAVDTVDVAANTVWLNGAEVAVALSAAELLTRGTVTGFIVNAITVDNAGAVAVIAGTEFTAFSTVIDDPGGPPYIPVDSILLSLVYLTNTASAVVLSTEIKQNRGQQMEMSSYPTWNINYAQGAVKFTSSLPLIHTGDAPKKVYASYAAITFPTNFTELNYTDNFKVPEDVLSKSDLQFHNEQTLVDVTSALVGGVFDITFNKDAGIASFMAAAKMDMRWLAAYPDKYKTPYFLCPPARVSFERDALTAANSNVKATVTMMSTEAAIEKTA